MIALYVSCDMIIFYPYVCDNMLCFLVLIALLTLCHLVRSLCFSSIFACLFILFMHFFACLFVSSSIAPTFDFVRVHTYLYTQNPESLFRSFSYWHICHMYSNPMDLRTSNPNLHLTLEDTFSLCWFD